MKMSSRKLMIALVAILPMVLVSCQDDFMFGVSGRGDIVKETVQLDDFDGFISTISADIYINQGDEQEVIIEAQQNIIDEINLDRVDNGIWTIHFRHIVHYARPIKIYITMPTLTKAGITGSGDIEGVTPFTGLDRLKLFITGSGSIDLDSDSKELDAEITGSGDMKLYGSSETVDLLISGSGGFLAKDLKTTDAEITITGSGNARLSVEEFLKVIITGSGTVYYAGNPEVELHVSGSGNVIRQ